MPLKQHPTDPDKMVYVSRQYDLPQRLWVGLTTAERKEIERQSVYVEGAIRMTEAKLKEKNHAN